MYFTTNMNFLIIFLTFVTLGSNQCVQSTEDSEVVILPIEWSNINATIPLSFTAFGKKINLLLQKNENLLTKNFEVWKRGNDKNLSKIFEDFPKSSSCHYIHEDAFSTAAVSLCDFKNMHGYVFFENGSLEIAPLSTKKPTEKSHRIQVRSSSSSSSSSSGEPHIIRKRGVPTNGQNQLFNMKEINFFSREKRSSISNSSNEFSEKVLPLTVELAVFLDAAAYGLFVPHVAGDEARLLDVLLAYVNNIQALFHHPSLGRRIDIALVRLELMSQQPQELEKLDGERSELLDAFCAYSKALNPADDKDPRHWDIGLYVSGLDFYAIEDGKKNSVTMGLAPVGGVCWSEYSCVIAEFGVSNRFGKPYPSAGFTSIYIAAHEIAHNLGMHHDSAGNNCPRDGYIMSPSRGTEGETLWSNCSSAVALNLTKDKPCLLDKPQLALEHRLDHVGRFGGRPGRSWTAKQQCEILLRDPEAVVDTLEDCCRALRCRSPERTGFYLAGPALDGTRCSDGKECRAGECLPADDKWKETPRESTTSQRPTGWSEWSEGKCKSGCIRGSLGYLERRRTCLGQLTCPGLNFNVSLCKDREVCEEDERKRLEVGEFAGRRCLTYAAWVPEIDGPAGGLQAGHEVERPWVACAVFCKMRDANSYYSPRLELNDLGVDPYFPDGTWCHKDGQGENYFCRRHHCLPENFRFGKGLIGEEEEERMGPMNAEPPGWRLPPELKKYFELGVDGRPLMTRLGPRLLEDAASPRDGESWLDSKDYVELPAEFLFRHPKPLRADFL